jgi:low temperature requirement protein LtrA
VKHLRARPAAPPATRVSTLELFFDLVFVFTITQLAALLPHGVTPLGLAQVVLLLGTTWWMYDGYLWLTNAVAPNSSLRRGLLITGMGGFLVMAIAVPHAFGGSGWAFGAAYLLVNAVHTGMIVRMADGGAARAMAQLAPLNAISAGLVLAGGLAPDGWRYGCWTAALAVQVVSPYLHPIGGFTVGPAHFVERHGLVVIIALGESVVAVGMGTAGFPVTLGRIAVAVLGLMLAYLLWWFYFGDESGGESGGDDARAEQRLSAIGDGERRARAALHAYGYAHYVLLIGIVVLAAGMHGAIAEAAHPLAVRAAVALGGGAALFLASEALFRWILRIGALRYRLAGALAALATVPLAWLTAWAQLAGLIAALGAVAAAERVSARRAR